MHPPRPTLPIAPLTHASYAPFGEVVAPSATGRRVNRGEALRHDHTAALVNLREGSTANLALFEIRHRPPPLGVDWLERHPLSTQVFLPLSAGRFIVTVAPGGSARPDPGEARAFAVESGTGITYLPGVWHHGLIPLDGPMRFAMLVWEDGSAADCQIVDLATPLHLVEAGLV